MLQCNSFVQPWGGGLFKHRWVANEVTEETKCIYAHQFELDALQNPTMKQPHISTEARFYPPAVKVDTSLAHALWNG